ncbi:uncharacterized protein LOC135392394 [Ornithodoros turicata]|uniref:uncharacterized protein LOC135392394 n=1 Tax=Ornithodoros turicata TaxID=34597 RepID=UPI003139CC50
MLRGRFVCGLRDTHLPQRLLSERHLTFRIAYDMAKAAEAAATHQAQFRPREHSGKVHATAKTNAGLGSAQKPRGNDGKPKDSFQRHDCYRCLGSHKRTDCPFRTAICFSCGKPGHLRKACQKRKQKGGKTHVVQEEQKDSDLYNLHQVHSVHSTVPRYTVTLRVDDKLVPFEVDSGCAYTLISEETYTATWIKKPPWLGPVEVGLQTWSGEPMKLKGSVEVRVRWKSKDYLLPLLVVKGTGCSLLGRNWFQPLNIKISGVNSVPAATSIDALLSKFSSVFADPCEGHAGPPVEIELKGTEK